jgi:pimeloyl-[acyl-carrier protein] methyl ester esterase
MLKTATISGWGQPHDSIQLLVPNAHAIAYDHHNNVATALQDIAHAAKECELLIGWSLGGQLLVRAIAAGMVRPKKLVLIAAPFQFVARPSNIIGMPADLYQTFYANYAENPKKTMTKVWASIIKGDTHSALMRTHLEALDTTRLEEKEWLYWLGVLRDFSCYDLYLADFPPTLLIHGDKDAVVYHEQSLLFKQAIPHAKLLTLQGCGHAPHWHDSEQIKQAIRNFADV